MGTVVIISCQQRRILVDFAAVFKSGNIQLNFKVEFHIHIQFLTGRINSTSINSLCVIIRFHGYQNIHYITIYGFDLKLSAYESRTLHNIC